MGDALTPEALLNLIPDEIVEVARHLHDVEVPDGWTARIHPNGWIDLRLGNHLLAGIGHHPRHAERERWWVSADDGHASQLRHTCSTLQAAVGWVREVWVPQLLAESRARRRG